MTANIKLIMIVTKILTAGCFVQLSLRNNTKLDQQSMPLKVDELRTKLFAMHSILEYERK